MAADAAVAVSCKRTDCFVLITVRSRMFRMAPRAVGVAAMAESDIVAACNVVATQAGDCLINQRVVGPPPELVDHRYMTVAAETGFPVKQLTLVSTVDRVAVGTRNILVQVGIKAGHACLKVRRMTLRAYALSSS